jgi:hypothetical protein
MKSKLAEYAEEQLVEAAKRLTREQRLVAFIEHSRRVGEFFRAGRQLRDSSKQMMPVDQL